MLQEEKGEKKTANNITEDIIYHKLFILKNQTKSMTAKKDSGAMSHIVKFEQNMTNLNIAETRIAIGDSITLTGKRCGDWNGYQRRDGKLHCVTLSNTYVIPPHPLPPLRCQIQVHNGPGRNKLCDYVLVAGDIGLHLL